jgi:hypothetical protein
MVSLGLAHLEYRTRSGKRVGTGRYRQVVPDLVERLEKRIRRHISESMPAKQGYFE